MKLLVKLGGTLLDQAELRESLCGQIAAAAAQHRTVVVHGGGKQMTRFLAERGIESRFVNGLRVTTPETMDAVVKVLAGSVNHTLVASLVRAGVQAVGISGVDALLCEAEQMDPALGAVGRVTKSNPALLDTLTGAGFLPVVACMAGDRAGNLYNVNADQMAVACASAFQADRLLFLTDVEGVLDGSKQVRSVLTSGDAEALIAAGVATGGMQAKLTAANAALANGVGEVRIVNGAAPNVIAQLIGGAGIGTTMVAGTGGAA